MVKKIVYSLVLVLVFFFNSCKPLDPKVKRVKSRATGWYINKLKREKERLVKQRKKADSLKTILIKLENDLTFLDDSTNDENNENAEKILNLEIEKGKLLSRISDLKKDIDVDSKKIKQTAKILKGYVDKNPTKKEFAVLAKDLEELSIRNNINIDIIFDYEARLKQIDDAISDLIVEECKLGRVISEEVIPFDFYFETGKCITTSDNPDFLVKFRKEIKSTVSDFLLQCPNMKIYLTITIEGFSDSQRFGTNSKQNNLLLSKCRAEAVKEALAYVRNDDLVNTNYEVVGLGEKLPYPNKRYKPKGSNDQSRRICKIKAVLKPVQNP
ncbi:MAG: hypothetical protein AAF611_09640 [Bacteroidota bacterium]